MKTCAGSNARSLCPSRGLDLRFLAHVPLLWCCLDSSGQLVMTMTRDAQIHVGAQVMMMAGLSARSIDHGQLRSPSAPPCQQSPPPCQPCQQSTQSRQPRAFLQGHLQGHAVWRARRTMMARLRRRAGF